METIPAVLISRTEKSPIENEHVSRAVHGDANRIDELGGRRWPVGVGLPVAAGDGGGHQSGAYFLDRVVLGVRDVEVALPVAGEGVGVVEAPPP